MIERTMPGEVRSERRPPHQGTRGFESALPSMLLARHDGALEWLRVGHVEGSWGVVMQYFPAFEPLVDRAEFVALLEETGLYEWPGRAGDPTEGSMNVHLTAGSWSTAARPTSWGLCSSSAPL